MQTNNTFNSTHLDPHQGLQLSKEIIVRKNQDGTVIVMRLDESAMFYKIDGIAAKVWSSLVERKTLSDLVSEFSDQHPQNKNQVDQDISNFVGDLLNKNLIIKC